MTARHLRHQSVAPLSVLPLAVLALLAAPLHAQPAADPDRPFAAVQPRVETGAMAFLDAHPEYDGRGITVAVFDTGVDPGAPGLQTTSDGRPKIVDVIDGSGSGDVDTTAVRRLRPDGTLRGITGRALTPDPDWTNPDGRFHVGMKPAFDIFPRGLVRQTIERRREQWGEPYRLVLEAARRELLELEARAGRRPDPAVQEQKTELEARIGLLEKLPGQIADPGPVYDCIVFHDGEVWRAAMDTDEDGEFADETTLASFRHERQYGTIGSDEEALNFVLNVYDDGKRLSVVTDAGSHGTHVAGIVAAHFPENPDLNGIAPGAQIVSVKIGDHRMGSGSSGAGEIRGLIAAHRAGCELINMSYGGFSPWPNQGNFNSLLNEFVHEHGLIFVASAGNSGPGLSSTGKPGATDSPTIGVGAAITPAMMDAMYSAELSEEAREQQFAWSSRGPATDGWLGIDITAPGGAIAPTPNWTRRRNMLMNGTSMSSPNATGCIALLLSGLKAEGIAWRPHVIRRALVNSARHMPGEDPFSEGYGMIRVDAAWAWLTGEDLSDELDVRYVASATLPRGASGRGVYLREPFEVSRPMEVGIQVRPVFHEDTPPARQIEFERRFAIEATQPWVRTPRHLLMSSGSRNFDVRIDPIGLAPGTHFAEVFLVEVGHESRGPVVRVPITVLRPETLDEPDGWESELTLAPGQVQRNFFAVPAGATWADIRLERLDPDTQRTLFLHATQLLPGQSPAANATRRGLSFSDGDAESVSVAVTGGRTLELALAARWSNAGSASFAVEVHFHGLLPAESTITINAARTCVPLDVTAYVRPAELQPSGSVDRVRTALRPASHHIAPIDRVRDRLPDERQLHELVLNWTATLPQDAQVRFTLGRPYSNEFDADLMFIFDSNKQFVGHAGRPRKLAAGTYTVRYMARHADVRELERLKGLYLLMDRDLPRNLSLAVVSHPDSANSPGGAFGRATLVPGESVRLWVAPPKDIPGWVSPGDQLIGTMSLGRRETNQPGAGARPGGWTVVVTIPPSGRTPAAAAANADGEARPGRRRGRRGDDTDAAPMQGDRGDRDRGPRAGGGNGAAAADEDDAAGPDSRDEPTRIREALRDFRVKQLGGIRSDELFDEQAAVLLAEWPDHLPLHRAILQNLAKRDSAAPADVIVAADGLIATIDRTALAAHYGLALDRDDPEQVRERKEMDTRKAALVTALRLRTEALYDQADAAGADVVDAANAAAEAAFDELARWTDTTAGDSFALHVARERRHGRLGQALTMINAKAKAEPFARQWVETRLELLIELGWDFQAEIERRRLIIAFPPDYSPF